MIRSITGSAGVRALGILLGAAALSLAVSGMTLAARDGSPASACQRDGWTVAQTSSGDTFASKAQCLSYVRFGGTVYKPSFIFDPSTVGINTDAFMHVTGFHPNSTGTLHQQILGGSGATLDFLNVPTDANGSMAVIGTFFSAQACTDGVTGAAWTFTDAYGVHAGATVTLTCRG